jgi:hypothetical protein
VECDGLGEMGAIIGGPRNFSRLPIYKFLRAFTSMLFKAPRKFSKSFLKVQQNPNGPSPPNPPISRQIFEKFTKNAAFFSTQTSTKKCILILKNSGWFSR